MVHVFNRTLGGIHRLKPVPEMVAGVNAILIKVQRRHKMKVAAYAFLSNHFHLVLRIRHTHQLSGFMRDLQSAVARFSFKQFGGPRLFWVPRYRSQELCTAAAVRRKVWYVAAHGTKERIVPNPTDWAGSTCARQMKDPSKAPRVFVIGEDGVERAHVLQLSRVPEDDGLPFPKWQKQQAELVASIEAEYAGQTFTGMARVMATPALWAPPQPAFERPPSTPMVQWDCTDAAGNLDETLLNEVVEHYGNVVGARAHAVDRTIRRGIADVEYPADCTFPHLIPLDLRARLVGCASSGARIRVPGTDTDPQNRSDEPLERAREARSRPLQPPILD